MAYSGSCAWHSKKSTSPSASMSTPKFKVVVITLSWNAGMPCCTRAMTPGSTECARVLPDAMVILRLRSCSGFCSAWRVSRKMSSTSMAAASMLRPAAFKLDT
ncbi:hypothetical protein D3C73_1198780 [compost metagenome]